MGNVWGVDYDDNIDEARKLRSSAGAAASWMSPIGPMTLFCLQIFLNILMMKQKVSILT